MARGVSEIYVADVLDKRLEKAKELGAARVFNSRNENIEEFVNLYPFHKDEVIKAVIRM